MWLISGDMMSTPLTAAGPMWSCGRWWLPSRSIPASCGTPVPGGCNLQHKLEPFYFCLSTSTTSREVIMLTISQMNLINSKFIQPHLLTSCWTWICHWGLTTPLCSCSGWWLRTRWTAWGRRTQSSQCKWRSCGTAEMTKLSYTLTQVANYVITILVVFVAWVSDVTCLWWSVVADGGDDVGPIRLWVGGGGCRGCAAAVLGVGGGLAVGLLLEMGNRGLVA